MSVSRARYFPIHRPVPPMTAAAAASTPALIRTPRRDGPPGRRRVTGAVRREARPAVQQPQGADPGDRGGQGRHHVAGLGGRPVERGERRDADQHQLERSAQREPAPREQPRHRREHQHPAHHRADEDPLVVGPELPDRPLLHRRGRQVDDLGADREHRRGGRVQQRGDEVAGRHADEGREDPEQGVGEPAAHAPCSERRRPRMATSAAGSRRTTCRPRPSATSASSSGTASLLTRSQPSISLPRISIRAGARLADQPLGVGRVAAQHQPALAARGDGHVAADEEGQAAEHLLLRHRPVGQQPADPLGEAPRRTPCRDHGTGRRQPRALSAELERDVGDRGAGQRVALHLDEALRQREREPVLVRLEHDGLHRPLVRPAPARPRGRARNSSVPMPGGGTPAAPGRSPSRPRRRWAGARSSCRRRRPRTPT